MLIYYIDYYRQKLKRSTCCIFGLFNFISACSYATTGVKPSFRCSAPIAT